MEGQTIGPDCPSIVAHLLYSRITESGQGATTVQTIELFYTLDRWPEVQRYLAAAGITHYIRQRFDFAHPERGWQTVSDTRSPIPEATAVTIPAAQDRILPVQPALL